MRLTRIHVAAALAPGLAVEIRGDAAAHLCRVLRLGKGDTVTLFNGDGGDFEARIVTAGRDAVLTEVIGERPARAESPLAIALAQGIARGDRMDLVVQKATELGVAAIQPLLTARSVVRLDATARRRKLAHWQGIAVAACEQSGRARLPQIAEPLPFADWLSRPAGPARRLQLEPDARPSLTAATAGAVAIELLVGPEGGLEDGERAFAARAGFQPAGLGPRVLRSETAAIAAIAVLQAAAGDLR